MINYKVILLHIFVIAFITSRLFFTCPQKGLICSPFQFTLFDPITMNIGEGADDLEFMGFMYMAKENILSLKHPFAHTNILRYPVGFDFNYGFDGAFAVLIGAILGFFGQMFLVYNSVVVTMLLVNYFVSYYFFKKISIRVFKTDGKTLPIFLASIIFAFSPYVFARASSHLNLLLVAGWPMIAYYLMRILYIEYDNVKKRTLLGLFIGLLLISFGSLQYLVLFVYTFIFLIIWLLIFDKERLLSLNTKVLIKNSVLPFIFFVVVFSTIFFGYIGAILTGVINFDYLGNKHIPAALLDIVVPNSYVGSIWSSINNSTISIEKSIAVGLSGLALILIFFFNRSISNKYKYGFVGVLFIWIFLSLSTFSLPYYPEGGRIAVIISLLLSLSVLLINSKKLLYALLILIVIERLFFSLYANKNHFALYEPVRNQPGEAVLNVPLSKYNSQRTVTPYLYDKKIWDGYFHYTADTLGPTEHFLNTNIKFFNCNYERHIPNERLVDYSNVYEIDKLLKQHRTQTIVYHKNDRFSDIDSLGCRNAKDFWELYKNPILYLNQQQESPTTHEFTFHPISAEKATVYFAAPGEFIITGIISYPPDMGGISIKHGQQSLLLNDFNITEAGSVANLPTPVTFTGAKGEAIEFKIYQAQGILKIYYVFITDDTNINESQEVQRRSLNLIYSDADTDFFNIEY